MNLGGIWQGKVSSIEDGEGVPSVAQAANIRKHVHAFMHDLFEAVKAEQDSSTDTSPGRLDSGNPTSFASGLSSLISQVSAGTAPPPLQSTFDRLAADIQSTAASPWAGSIGAPVSLHRLLAKLQEDLGHGAATAPASRARRARSLT
jgi:hypothetical protein